jgi:hypothetical protein
MSSRSSIIRRYVIKMLLPNMPSEIINIGNYEGWHRTKQVQSSAKLAKATFKDSFSDSTLEI